MKTRTSILTTILTVIFSISAVSAQPTQLNVAEYPEMEEYDSYPESLSFQQSGFNRLKNREYFKGLLIGAGIGGLTGGGIGAIAYTECTDTGFMACLSHPDSRGDAFLF